MHKLNWVGSEQSIGVEWVETVPILGGRKWGRLHELSNNFYVLVLIFQHRSSCDINSVFLSLVLPC